MGLWAGVGWGGQSFVKGLLETGWSPGKKFFHDPPTFGGRYRYIGGTRGRGQGLGAVQGSHPVQPWGLYGAKIDHFGSKIGVSEIGSE